MFNLNQWLDKSLKKSLWLWLPFYAFFDLIRQLGERKKK